MQDSGKAIQEKFSLQRELNRIKPEMEHLQSQLASYQTTVAEKNDLRRQVDSLEVELENEKRSRRRLQSKDDDTATAELKSRLETAEKKLAMEKKEREKAKKDHERELAAANTENERLEERITSLKEKSKALQAELKEAREQLEDVQSELANNKPRPVSRGEEKPKKAITLTTGDVGKKRRAPEMNFESITIQTPGNDIVARERPTKKRGADKSAVGAKSAFSITPFLNRNKSLTDDSAQEESSNDVPAEADPDPMSDGPVDQAPPSESEEEEPAPKPKVSFKSAVSFKSPAKPAKTRARQPKATPLGESTPAKANRVVKSRGTPKVKSIPDISVEKPGKSTDDSSATDQENVPVATSKKATAVLQSKALEAEAKTKKKRKLLGAANTTLFDDDDGEVVAQPKPKPVAGKRTRTALGGGVRNAFAAGTSFSPLKRDRRGVNASFLA